MSVMFWHVVFLTCQHTYSSTTLPQQTIPIVNEASKFCYSGTLTQASTKDCNKALLKILTSKDCLDNISSQAQDLRLYSNTVHPIVYISGSFNQNVDGLQSQRNVSVSLCPSRGDPIINIKCWPASTFRPQTFAQIFYRTFGQWKCNTWGLEAAAIHRHVKV